MGWPAAHIDFRGFDRYCVTDGQRIYGLHAISGVTYIQKYEPLNGDAVTTISSPQTQGAYRLAWFGGKLYALKWNSTAGFLEVWQWIKNTTWSRVLRVDAASIEAEGVEIPTPIQLEAPPLEFINTGSHLILVVGYDAIIGANERVYIKYTTDGANWATGSIDDTTYPHQFSTDQVGEQLQVAYAGAALALHIGGPFGSDQLFQFAGGNLVKRDGQLTGSLNYEISDSQKFWRGSGGGSWAHSTDCQSWTNPTPATVRPLSTNTRVPIGYQVDTVGNKIDLYFWKGGDWDTSEELITTILDTGNSVTNVIRLRDGTVFAYLTLNGSGSAWHKRGAPIGFDVNTEEYATARFYSGEGVLIERSDLPWQRVEIGGLAVRSDGRAALGNGRPGAPVVVTGEPDYAGWEDLSGSAPQDGKVSGVRWVE